MKFSLVLDDEVLIEFEKFKNSLECDKNIIENFVRGILKRTCNYP